MSDDASPPVRCTAWEEEQEAAISHARKMQETLNGMGAYDIAVIWKRREDEARKRIDENRRRSSTDPKLKQPTKPSRDRQQTGD